MKDKINIYWYKHNSGNGNFGDELNRYIIEKLSGKKARYIDLQFLNNDKFLAVKFLIYALLKNDLNLFLFVKYLFWNLFAKPKVVCAIGSILQYIKYNNAIVWGSGVISPKYTLLNANYLAVRGKYTQAQIRASNLNFPEVLGDPALLLPLIYQPKRLKKRCKIGVIPHYSHYGTVAAYGHSSFLLINLLDDIELIIDQINSCDFILSTSLHGLIVAHSYGIPALWVNFYELQNSLFGNDFKFKDYFSSVNIKEYDVVNMYINQIDNSVNRFSESNIDLLPSRNKINTICKDLLKVAPFTILHQYQIEDETRD